MNVMFDINQYNINDFGYVTELIFESVPSRMVNLAKSDYVG